MMKSKAMSRRGAFERVVAVLAALFGLPAVAAAARQSGDAIDGEWAFDRTVYRRFDEYGRVIMEIHPSARERVWMTFYG